MTSLETMARKEPKPFLMRGEPRVTKRRDTLADRPDRRVSEVSVRPLTPSQLRMLARDTALDPRFRAVDRFLWRWAVGHGTGLPPDDPDFLREARPSPLPPEDAIKVDEIMHEAPEWARAFVVWWFRSDATVEEIAERLSCRSRAVYDERKLVLAYFLGRLVEADIRIPTWEATT